MRRKVSGEIRGWAEVPIVLHWVLFLLLLDLLKDNYVIVILPSWLLRFSFLDS